MPHYPKPFFKKARGLWYVQINGKQINLGPDKTEAFRQYHGLMMDPTDVKVGIRSLAAIMDAFLDWHLKNRAKSSYEDYRYRLELFARKYPNLRAEDIRPYHVEQWADDYPGHSVTTRRNYFRAVKRCLRWAVQQGYLDKSPIAHMEVPSAGRRERFVTPEEFKLYRSYVRNDSLQYLLDITWDCGCRPQESLRVEVRHVDIKNRRWIFPKEEAKGKKAVRIVYLTDAAFSITEKLMTQVDDGHLFRNTNGRPWSPDSVNSALDAVRRRIGKDRMKENGEVITDKQIATLAATLKSVRSVNGREIEKTASDLRSEAKYKLITRRAYDLVPRVSLYALRHSWATNALQQGVDPLTVGILMGHRDPSTLSRVYQHLSLSPDHMLSQAKRAAVRS